MAKISLNRFIDRHASQYDYTGTIWRKDQTGRRVKVALFERYPDSAWRYKNLAPCAIRRSYVQAPEIQRLLYGVTIVQAH